MNVVHMKTNTTDAAAVDLFSYAGLSREVETIAREAAERIKLRLRRSAEDIIEIGRDLIGVKDRIGHGNFLPWIEAEFGMTDRTARRFMDVARVYSGKSDIVSNIDTTALYELAAPKTPVEVREEIEKMIEAGEVVTKAEVIRIKSEFEDAKRGKVLAEQNAENSSKRVQELATALERAKPDGASLDEIEAAKAQAWEEAEEQLGSKARELAEANVTLKRTVSDLRQQLSSYDAGKSGTGWHKSVASRYTQEWRHTCANFLGGAVIKW